MAIHIDNQQTAIFEKSNAIAIPVSAGSQRRNKIGSLKKSISTNSIKISLYNKRINYRNGNNSSLNLDNYSQLYSSSFRKSRHPLSDSIGDIEVYDYDELESEEYDYSDDTSMSSCSTQSTSMSSSDASVTATLPYIVKKATTDSIVSNVNIPCKLAKPSSTDSLIKLLNDQSSLSSPMPSSPFSNTSPTTKKNLVSNLTNSFKNLKNSIHKSSQSIWTYSINPRMTDDVLPNKTPEALQAQELTTFNISQCTDDSPLLRQPSSKCFKNRDQRINSSFLRLYSYDYTARRNGYLPNSHTNDEYLKLVQLNPPLKEFHSKYDFYRISNLSRDKLWNSVILPPRSDVSPGFSIDSSTYIYVGNNDEEKNYTSLITSNSNYLPWNSKQFSLKPAGALRNCKACENGKSPNSGITKTQFTIRGWCNPRWLDCSKDL